MTIERKWLSDDVALKTDQGTWFGKSFVYPRVKTMGIPSKPEGTKHLYWQDDKACKIRVVNGKIERIVYVGQDDLLPVVKLVLAYDGSAYHGFQIQRRYKTVQGVISKVISEIENEKMLVQGASRTDAGVHARYQVIHFPSKRDFSEDKWIRVLNTMLPEDMLVLSASWMPPLFHSRYDTFKKAYVYTINKGVYDPFLRHLEWHTGPIDESRLKQRLSQFEGVHDFSSFSKGDKEDTIRHIQSIHVTNEKQRLKIRIVGDGFLHHMVRYMVYEAAIGEEDIFSLLSNQEEKGALKNMAPATGLCLDYIWYAYRSY